MPTPDQWEVVGALGAVIIFIGTVALNFRGILGFFRRPGGRKAAGPSPDAAALVEASRALVSATQSMAERAGRTSPEAEALIEATCELVKATQVLAERSDSLARIHQRLDGMNADVGKLATELAEVRGELTAINRTLHLINEHLIKAP